MKMTVMSIGGPVMESRTFAENRTLVFSNGVRAAHAFFVGDDATIGIDVPTLDYLDFEEMDGRTIYIRLATIETMKARCKVMLDDEEEQQWENRDKYPQS